jgi:tetratricopeptide (TPR) repeat protein
MRSHPMAGAGPTSALPSTIADLPGARDLRDRSRRGERFAVGAILACFFVLAAPRVDRFLLLEPDSADYAIMSLSLVRTGEYRAPCDPSGLRHVWRPPALSAILIPAALARPGSVAACKATVLLLSLAGIALVYRMARDAENAKSACLVAVLYASNPATLLWSTEVVSEPPYVLCSLIVLHMLGSPTRASVATAVIAGLILGLLPLVRTVGLSLTLAAAIWLAISGRKRLLIVLLPLAAGPYAAWLALRPTDGQESYLSALLGGLRGSGLGETGARWVTTALLNIGHLLTVLVPGGFPGIPFSSMVTTYPSTLAVGAQPLALLLACCLLVLCALGLWARGREAGGLAAVYLTIYLFGLSFWPSRNERFLWPILAPLLIFLPTGLRALLLRSSRRSGRAFRSAGRAWFAVTALLIGWQFLVSLGMAATSLMWHSNPDAPRNASLPGYFADCECAGQWLREHSLPFDRTLTARSALFLSSGRYQKSMLLGPSELAGKIRALPARYIAVADGPFGFQFNPYFRFGDWVYQFVECYNNRGVAIVEVIPNRTGTIERTRPDTQGSIRAVTARILQEPWRFDLRAARASLLDISGQSEAATNEWDRLAASGRADLEALLGLCSAAMRARRFERALSLAKAAAAQPGSEFTEQVQILCHLAEQGLRGEYSPEDEIANEISQCMWLAMQRRFDEAEAGLDRLVESHPTSGTALLGRGQFYQRTSRPHAARADFERAAALGERRAELKLELMARDEAVCAGTLSRFSISGKSAVVDPSAPADHLRLADALIKDGIPGRALEVLERALTRFGEQSELLVPLASLYCDFAFPQKAEPLYRAALKKDPRNVDALIGLERCRELQRVP